MEMYLFLGQEFTWIPSFMMESETSLGLGRLEE